MRTHALLAISSATLAISSATAVAILSAILPAQAQDKPRQANAPFAITSPLKTIYRVSGLRDNGGGAELGVAASFHCTNFSAVPERIKFLIRDDDSTVRANVNFDLTAFRTWTASTHFTGVFAEDASLATGILNQGSAIIQSTSPNVHCSAMIVDAAAAVPEGIALHMVRFNPATGSQE